MSDEAPSSLIRGLGAALAVVGLVWLSLSGLCTASLSIMALVNKAMDIIPITVLGGAISGLIGWGAYALGKAIRGKPEQK